MAEHASLPITTLWRWLLVLAYLVDCIMLMLGWRCMGDVAASPNWCR